MTRAKVLLMVAAMLTGMNLMSGTMFACSISSRGDFWRLGLGAFASAFGLYASWQLLGSLIEEAAWRARAETWHEAAEAAKRARDEAIAEMTRQEGS